MNDQELLKRRWDDLERKFAEAEQMMESTRGQLDKLSKFIKHFADTGDVGDKYEMSSEAWLARAKETVSNLMKTNKTMYPTENSVLAQVYVRLRDNYGIVLSQLRKDMQTKYNMLRLPKAIEAISYDAMTRSIFDSVLCSMLPEHFFKDEAMEMMAEYEAPQPEPEVVEEEPPVIKDPEEIAMEMLYPLAAAIHDKSDGFKTTFDLVCSNMDCNWGNISTRLMKRCGLEEAPSKIEAIVANKAVMGKYKRAIRNLSERFGCEIHPDASKSRKGISCTKTVLPDNFEDVADRFVSGDLSIPKAAKELNLAYSTAYKYLNLYKAGGSEAVYG